MILRDFIRRVRVARLDDNAVQADGSPGTRMWSDQEIIDAAKEAQDQAVIRARLLRDEYTPGVCVIPIVAGQAEYELHWSVYDIDTVIYTDTGRELKRTEEDYLRDGSCLSDGYGYEGPFGTWQNRTQGRARHYLQKQTARERIRLRLYPIALEATHVDRVTNVDVPTTLSLSVYRLPIMPLRAPSDQFEIHDRHCIKLIDFALGRLYSKGDNDGGDPQMSEKCFKRFEESFGEMPSALTMTDRAHRTSSTVTPFGV